MPALQRKLLFIINPNSGKKDPAGIMKLLAERMPSKVPYQITIWKDIADFSEISRLLDSGDFTDAVAVGGDGTVNRVAQEILQTDILLGIIPIGSGNGLARSLGISMKPVTALEQIIEGRSANIDTGMVNGRL